MYPYHSCIDLQFCLFQCLSTLANLRCMDMCSGRQKCAVEGHTWPMTKWLHIPSFQGQIWVFQATNSGSSKPRRDRFKYNGSCPSIICIEVWCNCQFGQLVTIELGRGDILFFALVLPWIWYKVNTELNWKQIERVKKKLSVFLLFLTTSYLN